jgi:hypothetical protein
MSVELVTLKYIAARGDRAYEHNGLMFRAKVENEYRIRSIEEPKNHLAHEFFGSGRWVLRHEGRQWFEIIREISCI